MRVDEDQWFSVKLMRYHGSLTSLVCFPGTGKFFHHSNLEAKETGRRRVENETWKSAVVWILNVPPELVCWSLGSQLMALLGSCGNIKKGASLEETGHWVSVLQEYIGTQPLSPSLSFCFLTAMMWTALLYHVFPAMILSFLTSPKGQRQSEQGSNLWNYEPK